MKPVSILQTVRDQAYKEGFGQAIQVCQDEAFFKGYQEAAQASDGQAVRWGMVGFMLGAVCAGIVGGLV